MEQGLGRRRIFQGTGFLMATQATWLAGTRKLGWTNQRAMLLQQLQEDAVIVHCGCEVSSNGCVNEVTMPLFSSNCVLNGANGGGAHKRRN